MYVCAHTRTHDYVHTYACVCTLKSIKNLLLVPGSESSVEYETAPPLTQHSQFFKNLALRPDLALYLKSLCLTLLGSWGYMCTLPHLMSHICSLDIFRDLILGGGSHPFYKEVCCVYAPVYMNTNAYRCMWSEHTHGGGCAHVPEWHGCIS